MQHRAWRSGVACSAIAGVVLHAADANGQEHRLELEWSAPPACPTRADVLQTIDELEFLLFRCQRETPNCFSISAIIGWVKPAFRSCTKSSAMTRSHRRLFGPETGLPT